ncbi:MAG: hypothetical protein AB7O68_00775 [Pirellulales bacterium]
MIPLLDLDAGEIHEQPIDTAIDARRDVRHLPLAVVELADRANFLEQLAPLNGFGFQAGSRFQVVARAW